MAWKFIYLILLRMKSSTIFLEFWLKNTNSLIWSILSNSNFWPKICVLTHCASWHPAKKERQTSRFHIISTSYISCLTHSNTHLFSMHICIHVKCGPNYHFSGREFYVSVWQLQFHLLDWFVIAFVQKQLLALLKEVSS